MSLPEGDRLTQARNRYFPHQEILANKQLRWWWNNTHQAVYDNGDGQGFAPHGPKTEWDPAAKSIITLEYGFAACDKSTNQPNVFFDPKSTESFTAYWSIWDPANELSYLPRRDDTLQALALQAVYEYWNVDGNNESAGGLPMLKWNFCCVWNTDARPFPTFPILNNAWGDAGNWPQGLWIGTTRAVLPPPPPSLPSTPPEFPTLSLGPALSWSVHIKPKFNTEVGRHVSGGETRTQRFANPFFDVDLTYDLLRADAASLELQAIAGFFEQAGGATAPFWVEPPGLSAVTGQAIGVGNGSQKAFPLMVSFGPYTGPVYGTSGVAAVYLNGVAQPSGWSVSNGYLPAITFMSAPGVGVEIAADFRILWLCRFAEDIQDFEEFMTTLWALRTVRFMTVRP